MPPVPALPAPSLALYAGAVALLTFAAGLAYRRAWRRSRRDGATPTGFGVFLAPVMLGAALVAHGSGTIVAALLVVVPATAIYWIDDLIQLSARFRIGVSLLAGMGIGLAWLPAYGAYGPVLFAMPLAAGCVCVVLTNMVNFYDGADLNLASFIALTAAILCLAPSHGDWAPVALGALAFVLPFGMINCRPRTLYLGDAGSFAFAGLLTAMAVGFVRDIASLPPEAAIPAALPALDAAYVFAVRIAEKHDMLTRNYLHLYQRLSRRYDGFGYLVPQFVNAALCLSGAAVLQAMGVGRILSVIAAMILVTVPFYVLCRRLFLAGPPEGPLYETSR